MTTILRILLCGLLVSAPWFCGAVTPRPHFYLGAGLMVIALLQSVHRLFPANGTRSEGIPVLLVVLLGFLLIGGGQLSSIGEAHPLQSLQSLALHDLVPGLVASPELSGFARGQHTVSPIATQLMLAQLAMLVLAFWLSFELFEETESRRWLYLALAINGLTITGFGIAQQLTWNGKLFWTIPLRDGGSPFGPFVNRNNGAGYLLITFACAVSGLVVARFPFGLGQKPTHASLRLRFSTWLMSLLGHLTPGVMFSGLTVAVIAIGILMSLSRAGAVGLLAATLVLIPVFSRWRTRMLVGVVVLFSLAYAATIWLGQDERIAQRLGTLGSLMSALRGRVEHWQQITLLVQDVPWTGSGWGTYPLVNPVYLSSSPGGWFQNAENEYIEILAEAGLVGLALFVTGLLLFAYASARAIRGDQEGRQLASGFCGLLAVAGLSVISLTDFSLSIGSIALTFAVLAGSVYSPYSRLRPVSPWILIGCRRPAWRVLVSAGLLLISGLALHSIHAAAEVEVAVDTIPPEGPLPTLEVIECDAILSRLRTLNTQYPKQPEIDAAIGELRIYRYRRMLYDDFLKNDPQAKAMGNRALWGVTHLERLDAVITDLRNNGDSDGESRLLDRPEIADNLPAAMAALDRCVQRNPLRRNVAMQRAWLSHILNRPTTTIDRDLAMFVGTCDPEILFQAGQLSQRLGQTVTRDRCWKRSLDLSDQWAVWIWDEATLRGSEATALALYPDRIGPLMMVVTARRDIELRPEILQRCRAIAKADTTIPTLSLARLHMELDDLPLAAETYLQAIRESPYDIDLRLEASVPLERTGQLEMARTVVGVAHNLASNRADVTARFQVLISEESGNANNTRSEVNGPHSFESD